MEPAVFLGYMKNLGTSDENKVKCMVQEPM